MDRNRRGGIVYVKADGELFEGKGEFTLQPGRPKREPIIGSDGKVHGYKETAQAATLTGAITVPLDKSMVKIIEADHLTITVEFNDGHSWLLREAWYSGAGEIKSEESEADVAWTSRYPAEEI